MIPVRTSPEGAVLISYKDLVERPAELRESIESGFGNKEGTLGIVVIEDLPAEFPALRERLLRLSNAFASLPDAAREKYADPKANYSFGWSLGKEVMNGKPDLNKGSYYANPLVDRPAVSAAERDANPMYYRPNIWPNPGEAGLDGFEVAFKELGTFMFEVGCLLAKACESFVSESLLDASQSVENLIRTSQCNKARLLHYFAPSATPDVSSVEETEALKDDYCGIHLDHSLLTALCSALYLFHPTDGSHEAHPPAVKAPYADSGLYIVPREGGAQVKVSIPANCLAFQTGEALQLCTGHRLKATPHYVQAGSGPSPVVVDGVKGTVTRETFAFFLQPDVHAVVDASGKTFGEFSKEVIAEHY